MSCRALLYLNKGLWDALDCNYNRIVRAMFCNFSGLDIIGTIGGGTIGSATAISFLKAIWETLTCGGS